jgi:hypothetical protein
MTPKPPFEDRLNDWMEDGPTDAPEPLLDTVLAAFPSIPQRRGAWRIPWRSTPMSGFARLLAVLVIAIGLGTAAVLVALGPGSTGVGSPGGSSSPAAVIATPAPSASAVATPVATPAETPVVSSAPVETPAATAVPPCDPANLAARITGWDGAAGHQTAHLELTNAGATPCFIQAVEVPQLVDGHGSVIINGPPPTSPDPILTIAPGGVLKTMVQDGNYCGPAPAAPVSVAFVLADGRRIVATPFSPTDTTMPGCSGAGSPADISMQPWAP